MDDAIKENVKVKSTWLRGLFILVFAFIYSIAKVVIFAIVIGQFLFVLFNGDRNEKLLTLGNQVSVFIFQILQFMTFNTDQKPFPFDDWPKN